MSGEGFWSGWVLQRAWEYKNSYHFFMIFCTTILLLIYHTTRMLIHTVGHLPQKQHDYRRKYRTLASTYVTFGPDGNELLVNLGGEQIYLFDVNRHQLPQRFDISIRQKIGPAVQSEFKGFSLSCCVLYTGCCLSDHRSCTTRVLDLDLSWTRVHVPVDLDLRPKDLDLDLTPVDLDLDID